MQGRAATTPQAPQFKGSAWASVHRPPQQIQALPLQLFPSATGVPVSWHVGRPPSHARAPTSQGFAGVQGPPGVQPPVDEPPLLELERPPVVVPVVPLPVAVESPVVPVPLVVGGPPVDLLAPVEDEALPAVPPVLAAAVVVPPLDPVAPELPAEDLPPAEALEVLLPFPSPALWRQPARSNAAAAGSANGRDAFPRERRRSAAGTRR